MSKEQTFKAVCQVKALADAFNAVATVVPLRSPKPVLTNVLMTAGDDGSVTLSATDLEIGVRQRVDGVKADVPGSVLLPSGRFGQILRSASDESLLIDSDGENITVKGKSSRFTLATESADLYPGFPEIDAKGEIWLTRKTIRNLIRLTLFATDPDSTRYALNGVLVETDEDRVTFVGTDGRRLALVRAPSKTVVAVPDTGFQTILPIKALKLIDRTFGGSDDSEVCVSIGSRYGMVFRSGNAEVHSRLVEGRFPKYDEILGSRGDHSIHVVAGILRSAVEQAAVATSEESRGIEFEFRDGAICLSAECSDVGKSNVTVDVGYTGPETVMTLDHRYTLDVLRTIDEETLVTFEFTDGNKPGVVTVRGDYDYDYVIMPLTKG